VEPKSDFGVSNLRMLVSCVEVLGGKIYHCHYVNKLSSMVYGILFYRMNLVIPCSGRLYVVLVERILFGFVYKVNEACSFGECMCLCSFDRKSMYMPQALINKLAKCNKRMNITKCDYKLVH
jgi:hypothetical protein